jgi:hypothetical protein
MKKLYYVFAAAIATSVTAHELTPTYPKLRSSYIEGVSVTDMKMWNRRNDVKYYEINVFDKEWNLVPFATQQRLLKLEYLSHKSFEIYIRDQDIKRAEYICTTSKQLKEDVSSSGVKSKICSRIK